jgi:succinate dehydrogenase / fumarate reductase cytochrome b subunit
MYNNKAPVNLDLLSIRMPVTAVVSILHRITGLLLFISMPFCLLFFELILSQATTATQFTYLFSLWYVRCLLFLVLWSLVHHLFAGLRFLFLDIDIGVTRNAARGSAWVILVLDSISLLVLGGVFL